MKMATDGACFKRRQSPSRLECHSSAGAGFFRSIRIDIKRTRLAIDDFGELWLSAIFVAGFGCFWLMFGTVAWALSRDVELAVVGEGVFATIALGVVFLGLQFSEHYQAYTRLGLTLGSGAYGATFFVLTGFHGLHVAIGANDVLRSGSYSKTLTFTVSTTTP